MLRRHFLSDEPSQALQVLAVQLNVIVSRPLHPQRLHSLGAALEQSQAVGEVDHLVFCPVDDEHRRRDFGHFLNAGRDKDKQCSTTWIHHLRTAIKYQRHLNTILNIIAAARLFTGLCFNVDWPRGATERRRRNGDSLWEGVEAVRFLGVWKSHPHARGQR